MLNALRHHRGRHVQLERHAAHCSRRAQRLAASQRSARTSSTDRLPRTPTCSTPCGITEVGTFSVRIAGMAVVQSVLNALRHHRGRHDRSPACSRRRPCCAQRLAASQRSARLSPRWSLTALLGCSTPCGITEVGTGHGLTPRAVHSAMCSTPCGITEVGTIGAAAAQRRRFMCSTPCGITEVGTRWRPRPIAPMHGCSTPCGITEVGTQLDRAVDADASRCAQRLAASRGWHISILEPACAVARCSTPCGITEVGTLNERCDTAQCRRCSTPCGIRGWHSSADQA